MAGCRSNEPPKSAVFSVFGGNRTILHAEIRRSPYRGAEENGGFGENGEKMNKEQEND
jgi:hypothetical protein